MSLTVRDVSRLARISVRTLHHYDEIGLLRPSQRSDAGYRLYSAGDLDLLQQVLFFRELGFSLDAIRTIVSSPSFDRAEALEVQHGLLEEKLERTQAMLRAVERELITLKEGGTMSLTDEERFEVFGDFDPADYEDEVKERWGETDAYTESARRTKKYTKDDWARFKAESEEIGTDAAALMDEGVAPDDERAMDVVERARLQIDTWFYPCSHQMHSNLAEMYIADPRFTATYEKIRTGMAQWWHDAIIANAERNARR